MEITGKDETTCLDDCPYNHPVEAIKQGTFTPLCQEDGDRCHECLTQELTEEYTWTNL